MMIVRQQLSETDGRIAAALMASPRASWRAVGLALGISERTVVRHAASLFGDGTLRATAVRNPVRFPDLVPLALRIRCQPNRISAVAASLARRPDTIWVDILGGGDEICAVLHLDGPDARNKLLLRDLPATSAVQSWTSHTLLRVFAAGFDWSGGLLSPDELTALRPDVRTPADTSVTFAVDDPLITALVDDARAPYTDLARQTGVGVLTVRRRVQRLVDSQFLRLATEVDLARLGVHAEALLWINVAPGALEETGHRLSRHAQVRFTAATTGTSNLLVAVAAADLTTLYRFLSDTVGALDHVSVIDVAPILTGVKRTGLVRPSSL